MKKSFKTKTAKVLLFVMLFSFVSSVFAGNVFAKESDSLEEQQKIREDYQMLIDREKGTLFEKAVANLLASVAYFLTSVGNSVLGFKDLDALLFNRGADENLPPFQNDYWNKMNRWYKSMSVIAASLLFFATAFVAFKFIKAGTNPKVREEAMKALKRLAFSWIIVVGAPIFVKLLIYTNNLLVDALSPLINGKSVAEQLGTQKDGILFKVKTGNVIATALIIIMFAFINFKLNIMFLIRIFVMTTLYIFTPFVAVMWVISEDVNAAGIWLGEMISNAFMQFAYAFVFSIYLSFAGEEIHWATAIIWGLMIMTVADVIRNSVQSIHARLSGIDESRHASRMMGLFGLAGIPSMMSTMGGQVSSIRGPGGGALGRAINIASKAGGGFMAQGATDTSGSSQLKVGDSISSDAQGPNQMGFASSGPTGSSIAKASVIGSALDQSTGASYYTERGLSSLGTVGSAVSGSGGSRFAQGMSKAVGAGVRAVGGAVGMGMATKKYMKENDITFKEAIQELTGSDNLASASLRVANLYASHVFSSPQRVRDKLASYHATSVDGMRYK